MTETIRTNIETVRQWCKEVLNKWVEDEFIVATWTEIALNRDMIGDFPRGTARLQSIVERLEQGVLTRRRKRWNL